MLFTSSIPLIHNNVFTFVRILCVILLGKQPVVVDNNRPAGGGGGGRSGAGGAGGGAGGGRGNSGGGGVGGMPGGGKAAGHGSRLGVTGKKMSTTKAGNQGSSAAADSATGAPPPNPNPPPAPVHKEFFTLQRRSLSYLRRLIDELSYKPGDVNIGKMLQAYGRKRINVSK